MQDTGGDGYRHSASVKHSKPLKGRPHPLLIVLATLGGLWLLMGLSFFGVFFYSFHKIANLEPVVISEEAGNDGIGIIEINGMIIDAEPALKVIRSFRKREDVRAVIVRINSPGGAVGASQEIFLALKELDRIKPVVASMESVAASGGYYVAIGAREIVANPGTLTGSIGVIMKVANIGALLEKLGIKEQVLKSGDYKDTGSITRDMTDAERAIVEGVLKDVHNQFIKDVETQRGISHSMIKNIAQGQIFSGRQAKGLGLIDMLGNFDTAIERAKELSNIKGEPVLIYPPEDKLKFILNTLRKGVLWGIEGILRNTRGLRVEYNAS